ncbi:hypothetical protein FZEAL_9463 [Fusarium zealandicum]|uniref:Protein kinase domain-containing protein n=1 Tax=Fusarium zealandicum TaxID=1053134 RepID=A0A8H4XF95_9HYPO|nr:hypothetical protein FZEAL_9463 [Fusarium zealandicum]
MSEQQDSIKLKPGAGGTFERPESAFRHFVSNAPGSKFPAEKADMPCISARDSHRTMIVRSLKRLEDIVDLYICSFNMGKDGWFFSDNPEVAKFGCLPKDPLYGLSKIKELYLKADPSYEGRYTIPVLWDKKTHTMVSNESSDIIRMFYTEFDHLLPEADREMNQPGGGFYPEDLQAEIDGINDWVYHTVNNGVYKSGFAFTQEAYEENVEKVFGSLGRLEELLSDRPFLLGDYITDADIRLFPTIVRFDLAYNPIFMCNLGTIRNDYPNLHLWLRRLYWDGSERTHGAFRKTTEPWIERYKNGYGEARQLVLGITDALRPYPTHIEVVATQLSSDQKQPTTLSLQQHFAQRGSERTSLYRMSTWRSIRRMIRTWPLMGLYRRPWPMSSAVAPRLDHSIPIEEEKTPNYHANRFYPIYLGQVLDGRYQVATKLGYGANSTVWLVRDLDRWRWSQEKYFAVKVNATRQPSRKVATENELDIMSHISQVNPQHKDLKPDNIMVKIEDTSIFDRDAQDEFENPLPQKHLNARTIYLSRNNYGPLSVPTGIIQIADFDLSVRTEPDQIHMGAIQGEMYRAPEVILNAGYTYSADIWSLGVMLWDLLEGKGLFNPTAPGKADEYDDQSHLGQIAALIGPPPQNLLSIGQRTSMFYKSNGELKDPDRIPGDLNFENTISCMSGEEKLKFIQFIKRMVRWSPEERNTAGELLDDPWLHEDFSQN